MCKSIRVQCEGKVKCVCTLAWIKYTRAAPDFHWKPLYLVVGKGPNEAMLASSFGWVNGCVNETMKNYLTPNNSPNYD